MLEQAEGHRRRHRRDARSHARGDRVSGDGRRQARVRAEADVLVGARSAASREEGGRQEGRHADGQPGPLAGRRAARPGVPAAGAIGDVREVHVWTNRPLAYWPQGMPRPAPHRRPIAAPLRWNNSGVMQRLARGDERQTIRCRTRSRGICSSASRRTSSITRSTTRSTGAAGWTGARARSATWARTSIDHPVWALKLGLPTSIETRLDAVRRHLLSECDDDVLRVPGAQGHAGGEAGVVRRRPDAAEAGGARRRSARRRRRHALRRQQGQDAAEHVRRSGRGCCRSSCTTRTARRRKSSRACRTSRTR